jgi:hypothetical protein
MRYLKGLVSTNVSLRFSPFLLAVVLAPAFMQTQYTCNSGDTRLASLELEVSGVNRLVFDPALRVYDLWLPGGETQATVRAVPMDPLARVTWYVPDGTGMLASGIIGVGGGEVTIDLPPDGYALYIGVLPPERAVNTYIVNMSPVCPQGDACANGGLPGTCTSGTCVPAAFPCTEQGIRVAIAAGSGPHTFDCNGPTVVTTLAEIVIDNDVVLDGEGNLIVDAGGAHRVFSTAEGVTAELIGFTTTGGSTTGEGGGILNAGVFTLTHSTVIGNTADIGGGVRNLETGTLIVATSDVSDNTAIRFGGGIHNGGQMEVVDSVISGNEAGEGSAGVSNWPEIAVMTLTRSTVNGNVSTDTGGGIGNMGTATLNATTVSENETGGHGGGIYNRGTLTASDTTLESNSAGSDGGGAYNFGGALTLVGTTVAGNTAVNSGGGIESYSGWTELIGTIVSGNTATYGIGGGIENTDQAALFVNSGIITGNTAVSQWGGGIANLGTFTVTNSTIAANTASAGGGLHNAFPGSMTVASSTVSDNTATRFGGGIYNHNDAFAEVADTTVSNNTAMIAAGGISNRPGATMTLTGGIVEGNIAETEGGGGIANAGTMTMSQVTVSSNSAVDDGGGVRNDENGTLAVNRSTVSDNSAGTWGGGIRNFGIANVIDTTVSNNTAVNGAAGTSNRPTGFMTITGSTVHGNTTPGNTGGVASTGTITLTNTTVSGNVSAGARGGIANLGTGSMTLVSTTVSGNIAPGGATGVWNVASLTARNTIIDGDCGATPLINSLGGNIESPGNTCFVPHPADQVFVTPEQLNLGPLQDNGGPTWTLALLPGSVAIDSVDECVNVAGFPLLVDQRGAPRPYGPACDSGAFELGAVPLPRDLCINDADRAVYESLVYVDGGGSPSTCTAAANSIASDCVFGSAFSSPPLLGCPGEAAEVLACYPSCPPDAIDALDQCVASCTAGATGLSTGCADCYGAWAGCGAQSCVPECAGDVGSPPCLDCLAAAGCTAIFDACFGGPANIDCSGGGTPVEYTQDFESLDQASPSALSDDGWLIWGQVVDANGDFKFGYGPFPAPSGTGSFCAIAAGEGGPDQGAQQLVVYNDYNCCDPPNQGHFNGTDRVTSLVFQEPFTEGNPISPDDVGKTFEFSFDAKRGGINDPTGSSTAEAYIQTVDPNADFARTSFVSVDMTNLPAGTWDRYSVSVTIHPALAGQSLNFGFMTNASNFELSDVFYDNIVAVLTAP